MPALKSGMSRSGTSEEEKPLVVITVASDLPVDVGSFKSVLGELAEVQIVDLPMRRLSSEEENDLVRKVANVSVLFVRSGIIGREVISSLKKLKAISVHGVGIDQIDVAAATDNDIMVTNVPGGNAEAVAELAIGIILALCRKIVTADSKVREGKWNEGRQNGLELKGKTLGIIGLGYIGSRMAELGRAFDMNVLGYDPYVKAERTRGMGIQPTDFGSVLEKSDVLSIHVPLNEHTKGMIGERELSLMKRTAILVNTSRGAIVDEKALTKALEKGVIAGASLDTLEEEPPNQTNRLLRMKNVVLTPHIGGSTEECLTTIALIAAEDISRILCGRIPRNLVNREGIPREPKAT
jgi:D-3-phosphoglycerate dehydrogenase